MASFDAVNEINIQEVDNAINNVTKEIVNRFDFKDSGTELNLNKKDNIITVITSDDMKMRTLRELIITAMVRRDVDSRSLEFGEPEAAGGKRLKRTIKLINGLDRDQARDIVSAIKDSKLKVQASIMDDKVRVTAKKIDDLQAVIQLLKTEVDVPLQFVNMKS